MVCSGHLCQVPSRIDQRLTQTPYNFGKSRRCSRRRNTSTLREAGALVVVSFPKPKGGSGFPARVYSRSCHREQCLNSSKIALKYAIVQWSKSAHEAHSNWRLSSFSRPMLSASSDDLADRILLHSGDRVFQSRAQSRSRSCSNYVARRGSSQ